ncbi:hypothetical protein QTP88_020441 [Uroleucon formosanum]
MATKVPELKVNLVAKEIELIKLLASNDPNTRSDGIKKIKQLLLDNSKDTSDAFQLNDYLIIWRGLFYFMWTSDKPVPQESVTEKISYLIHSCTSYQGKIFFLDAFFLTIKDNWMSIKQHRIDKCMMWARHFLRQLLFTFVNCDWILEYMNKFSEVLYRALKSFAPSLRTCLQVIFLEELAKVSRGKVPSEALVIILESFLHYISELNDFMLIREVTQNVFKNLLSPLPDSKTLEAKFQALQKIDPGNSNNDLELIECDIANDDSNELNDSSLDFQARNVCVEIPRIKINLKDVTKVLNKYLTEVDCTRKCLLEITKLIQFYNRMGNYTLPNKPKDLNLNRQVLKHKQKKYLSQMVKKGVKKLEMVDSRIKKSSLEIYNHKSLKELNKMGEIVVERGKIGKFMWKVKNFDNGHTFKNNLNLNNSWTVSQGKPNTVCINDDKPQILVPPGFSVEVFESSEKTPTKVQNKVSITPNFKSLITGSSLKKSNSIKRKSKSKILKMNNGTNKKNVKNQNSCIINNGTPHDLNSSHKRSISADHGGSASKKIKNIESANAAQSVNAPFNKTIFTPDNEIVEKKRIDDLVNEDLSKVKLCSDEININSRLNYNWSTCSKKKFKSSKCKFLVSNTANEPNEKRIQKSNSPLDEICSPNIVNISHNNTWSVSADNNNSASNKVQKRNSSSKMEKEILLTSLITAGKSFESPKSADFEQSILRQRTTIISINKPDGQNESTLKRKVKETPATKVLHERRKTIPGSKPGKAEKGISLTSVIAASKNSKSPKSSAFEQRILRRRTTIIPMNKSNLQKESKFKRKVKETSAAKVLHERRKTIIGSKPGKAEKGISLTTVIAASKNSKSPKSSAFEQRILRRRTTIIPKNKPDEKSPDFEQRILRRRTTIIPKNKPDGKSPDFEQRILRRRTTIIPKNEPDGKSPDFEQRILRRRTTIIPKNKPDEKSPDFEQRILRRRTTIIAKNEPDGKSPAFEQRILRRRTTIIPKNEPDGKSPDFEQRILRRRTTIIPKNKPDGKSPDFEQRILRRRTTIIPKKEPDGKSPAFEQRILRRRTTIIPKNKPDGKSPDFEQRILRRRTTIIPKNKPDGKSPDFEQRILRRRTTIIPKNKPDGKSPAFEQRILRRRTTIIPKNKPDGKSPDFEQRILRRRTTIIPKKEPDGKSPDFEQRILRRRTTIIPKKEPDGKSPDFEQRILRRRTTIIPKNKPDGKSPAFEQRILRRRTTIIPKNKPDGKSPDFEQRILRRRTTIIPKKEPDGKSPDFEQRILRRRTTIIPKNKPDGKSPDFEQRILRRRTTIIPMNKPDGQNENTPKRKVKETPATKILHERRKNIPGSKPGKAEKGISLTSVIAASKNSKSPKSPDFEQRILRRRTTIIPKNKPDGKSPAFEQKILRRRTTIIPMNKPDGKSHAFEQRILRRRTTIIPKNKPDGQNENTPKRKVKETSGMRVLQKCKDTLAGEEISMLRHEEISNKALEEVETEVFEDGFGSLRKSPRLSIKTDFYKK